MTDCAKPKMRMKNVRQRARRRISYLLLSAASGIAANVLILMQDPIRETAVDATYEPSVALIYAQVALQSKTNRHHPVIAMR